MKKVIATSLGLSLLAAQALTANATPSIFYYTNGTQNPHYSAIHVSILGTPRPDITSTLPVPAVLLQGYCKAQATNCTISFTVTDPTSQTVIKVADAVINTSVSGNFTLVSIKKYPHFDTKDPLVPGPLGNLTIIDN